MRSKFKRALLDCKGYVIIQEGAELFHQMKLLNLIDLVSTCNTV